MGKTIKNCTMNLLRDLKTSLHQVVERSHEGISVKRTEGFGQGGDRIVIFFSGFCI